MTTSQWAESQDDLDEVDEEDEDPGAGEPAEQSPAPGAGHTRRGRRASGARRDVERTMAVMRLAGSQRGLLARLYGLRGYDDGDDAMIVRLVMTSLDQSGKGTSAVVAKVIEIAQASQLEAGVLATELAVDKASLATAWTLLSAIGAVDEACPNTAARAGLAVAKASQSLKQATIDDLTKILGAIDS